MHLSLTEVCVFFLSQLFRCVSIFFKIGNIGIEHFYLKKNLNKER